MPGQDADGGRNDEDQRDSPMSLVGNPIARGDGVAVFAGGGWISGPCLA